MALTKVSTDGVKDDAITKTKIPANQIEASELADNAVDTNAIVDGAVTADKIASQTITSNKIGADAVGASELANSSVAPDNLQTNSVTTAKIANEAVTLNKLPHGDSNNDGKFLRANNGADPSFETVSGTTINNNADNRVITGSGTANTLEAESGVQVIGGVLMVGTTDSGESNGDEATFANSGNAGITIRSGVDDECKIYFSEGTSGGAQYRGAINYNHQYNFMAISTNETEKFRINSTGLTEHTSSNDTAYTLSIAGAIRFQFVHSGGGNMVISNPSTGNVTYSTSSDYRLKDNATTINNALTTVKALKTYQFTWKHDSKIGQGFFAHEVLETTPNSQAALGTKDAVEPKDDDNRKVKKGDPIYQGMDYSKLVPLLTAALQEVGTKIEALETKVAALEK